MSYIFACFILGICLNARPSYAEVTEEQIELFKKFKLPHVCSIHPLMGTKAQVKSSKAEPKEKEHNQTRSK